MSLRSGNISIIVLVFLISCTSFKGDRIYPSLNAKCESKLFLIPPENVDYEVLDLCKVKASSERVAFKKLDKCACRHGGNGLILQKSKTVIYQDDNGVNLMTLATFRGEVIRIRP